MPTYQPGNNEMLVNQITQGEQFPSSIVVLANGNYLVFSYGTGGEGQLFAQSGAKIGGAIDFSGADYGDIVAKPLAGGGFVTSWMQLDPSAPNTNVATFQVYDALGNPVGPPIHRGVAEGSPSHPEIWALPNGNFLAKWLDPDLTAQIFGPNGAPVSGEFTLQDDKASFDVIGFTTGAFVELAIDPGLRSYNLVFHNAEGAVVNQVSNATFFLGDATELAGGRVVVYSLDDLPTGKVWYRTVYNELGQEIAPPTVSPEPVSGLLTLDDGGYAVVERSNASQPALFDVQFYNSLGQPTASIPMPGGFPQTQGMQLTELSDGNLVLTWRAVDLKANVIDRAAGTVSDQVVLNETSGGGSPDWITVALPDGDFAITWRAPSGYNGDGSLSGVKTRVFTEQGSNLNGTNGDDILQGAQPGTADTFTGRNGNDTYYVDHPGDYVVEVSGGGSDRVFTSVGYVLDLYAEVELLSTLDHAGTAPIFLGGNQFAQLIQGNEGANFIDGRGGADRLVGYGGNDIYIVDNPGDVIEEAAGGGTDSVYTSISYVLNPFAEVETLSTANHRGTASLFLVGNGYAQTILGNDGDNYIDGRAGADIMVGWAGDDTYLVDNAGDDVHEEAGKGNDKVFASVSYALDSYDEVEMLSTDSHAGTVAINLVGSNYTNTLYGNAGNNILDGGLGADLMVGWGGNDSYIVDNALDDIHEEAGKGSDIAYASVSYALRSYSEIETLTARDQSSTVAINLTGNDFVNTIVGNAGNNILDGRGGNDVLAGLGGADTYLFTSAPGAGNVDLVVGFVSASDRVALDNAVFTDLAEGGLAAGAFVTGTQAADADDRLIYDSATGNLFFDADGSGGAAAVLFATLQGAPTLTANDFLII